MRSTCLALVALSWGLPAAAEEVRADLLDLKAQRAAIEAQFKAESDVCAQRFLVNACLDEAKGRRSTGLKPLQEREAVIDAQERRARADAQRERVAEREREFAEAEGRHRTAELLTQPAKPALSIAKTNPPSAPKASAQNLEAEQQNKAALTRESAQRRQAEKARYLSEQEARQKASAQRQASRAEHPTGKKSPAALPIPSAAEIEAASSAASVPKR